MDLLPAGCLVPAGKLLLEVLDQVVAQRWRIAAVRLCLLQADVVLSPSAPRVQALLPAGSAVFVDWRKELLDVSDCGDAACSTAVLPPCSFRAVVTVALGESVRGPELYALVAGLVRAGPGAALPFAVSVLTVPEVCVGLSTWLLGMFLQFYDRSEGDSRAGVLMTGSEGDPNAVLRLLGCKYVLPSAVGFVPGCTQ